MTDDYKDRVAAFLERKSERLRQVMNEGEEEEDFEILDVTRRGWFDKMFRDISKASVAKQMTVGAVSGWCSGYLFGKVGKAAAVTLGGTLLVLQVANHQGYITINWGKLEKNIKAAQRKLERRASRALPAIVDEVQDFVVENAFLAGGFCGGFFIGLVC